MTQEYFDFVSIARAIVVKKLANKLNTWTTGPRAGQMFHKNFSDHRAFKRMVDAHVRNEFQKYLHIGARIRALADEDLIK